jgi:hypothetical protein
MTADHVVVAPTGIWVVVAPMQRGIVQVTTEGLTLDGRRLLRDPRREAHTAAVVVRDLLQRELGLRLRVQAIVCFPRATVLARGVVSDPPVVAWDSLPGRIRRGTTILPASTRARIRRVLARRSAPEEAHPTIRLVSARTVRAIPA